MTERNAGGLDIYQYTQLDISMDDSDDNDDNDHVIA
jgi:hypothetical protein